MPPFARHWLFVPLLLFSLSAWSQCPQAGFTLPDTVCVNESISITNTTTGATQYNWDFCSGDLAQHPELREVVKVTGALTPSGITMASDGTNWFGFVSSRDNHTLIRLDFGMSLNNNPAIVNLGNPGNLLSRPEQIRIVKEGANWIGLVVNLNNFFNNYSVVRLEFGNSLTNIPTATRISSLDTYLQLPRGIEIVYDQNKWIVFIANTASNILSIVNFGSSLLNTPTATDVKQVSLPGATSGQNLTGLSLHKVCNEWWGIAVSFSNRVYRLRFGQSLLETPAVESLTAIQAMSISPVKVALLNEAGYHAVILGVDGRAVQLNFGQKISSEPTIGRILNRVSDVVAMDLVQVNSETLLYSVDWVSNKVFRFAYPNNCSSSATTSIAATPSSFSYTTGGTKYITLTAADASGNVNVFADSVFVRPPVVAGFTADKRCEGTATQFTADAAPTGNRITSWQWNFGDGNTATGANPTHTFTASGNYSVSLNTTDACGKTQTATRTVTITKKNTPDFSAPATVCSNTEVEFKDLSTGVNDEITAWGWDFGDGATANEQHPSHIFTSAGTYNVALVIIGKSGCSESITKSIIVKEGAAVGFTVENACLGEQTRFTDQTVFGVGTSLAARQWNFGDGATSTEANPTHQYASPGEYTVTLTIQNNLGCTTTQQQNINIRRLPVVNFSYSLACAGNATSFTDESTAENSNLTAWQWNFGDPASGAANVSAEQHPTHVFSAPGMYQVQLQAQTNYGCAGTITQTVEVIASPEASFTFGKTCGSKQVVFTDQSVSSAGNPVTGWYWSFGDGATSAQQHPTHTYGQPGEYTVELITTAASRCTGSFRQLIQVTESQPPAATITVQGNACMGSAITFSGETGNANDPVTAWQWDFGALGTSTEARPSLTTNSATTLNVQLTVTTQAGCTATASKTVQVAALPEVDFAYQTLSERTPLLFNFTGAYPEQVASITWDFGDGSGSTQRNPSHTYAGSGVYTVRLTAATAGGCSATAEKQIVVSSVPAVFALKLEAVEAATIDQTMQLQVRLFNGGTATIGQLSFTTVLDGKAPATHTWNGDLLPGTELIYRYSRELPAGFTPQTVCVIAQDVVHELTSNRQCRSLTGAFAMMEPYPNPATGKVTVPVWMPRLGSVHITFFNSLGQQVLAFPGKSLQAGFTQIPCDVQNLPAGLYYLRCDTDGKLTTKRLIIR